MIRVAVVDEEHVVFLLGQRFLLLLIVVREVAVGISLGELMVPAFSAREGNFTLNDVVFVGVFFDDDVVVGSMGGLLERRAIGEVLLEVRRRDP